MKKLAIIGGGAAGLMACLTACRNDNANITLYEKNEVLGRKLLITGKGRCNLTNACEISEFIPNVQNGGRFLYGALNTFSPSDTMDLFESMGVRLKVERGRRVFPESDKAADIRNALGDEIRRHKNVALCFSEVISVKKSGDTFIVSTATGDREFNSVIIATGGLSYPLTGSTGDGYRFATSFGHTINTPHPSLVPLVSDDKCCSALMGLSLKNVGVKFCKEESTKPIFEDFGEMLFTHFGVSGPIILSASAYLKDISSGARYDLHIDLKPALSEEELNRRLLSDFEKYKNKDYLHSLDDLLPKSIIPEIIKRSSIDPHKKVNEITKAERIALVGILKRFSIRITATRPISEAIITAGGVDLKEINPKTMESKLCPGLFFAGEVIDADAYTGGYNLQIAFSTAVVAANNAVK